MKRFLLLSSLFFLPLGIQAQTFNEIQKLYKDAKNKGQDSLTAVYAMKLAVEGYDLNRERGKTVVTFESMFYYCRDAFTAASNMKDTVLMGEARISLARAYRERASLLKKKGKRKEFRKDVIDALSTLEEARKLFDQSNDTLNYAKVQEEASNILSNYRNDNSRAVEAMIEAMDFYEKAKAFDEAQDCARRLVDIYRKLGQGSQASFYEQEAVRLSSSAQELAQRDLLIQRKQDSLQLQQDRLRIQEQDIAIQRENEARLKAEAAQQRTFLIYTVLVAALILVFLVLALRVQRKISSQKKEVEKLLLNILPKKTAEELRLKGSATPQSYPRVTVIFTDFKGFTQVSEKMTPEEIIEELGICFSAFDEIVEKNNLEKIKTIGDAYMCAGGVPQPNQSNPVDAARAALAMQAFMANRIEENRLHGRAILELRIGIHTGAVVAGVVGKKKFAYDIWGDAVNIAARMESSGEPNKVNISGETFSLIKDQFNCTYRGKIPAKNKGEVDMYFIDGES